MGLVVVGFGLLDIALWYWALNTIYDSNIFNMGLSIAQEVGLASDGGAWMSSFTTDGAWMHTKMIHITTTMLTFGMGASTQALFARVGGGIFTKAADLGSDLVGKI